MLRFEGQLESSCMLSAFWDFVVVEVFLPANCVAREKSLDFFEPWFPFYRVLISLGSTVNLKHCKGYFM